MPNIELSDSTLKKLFKLSDTDVPKIVGDFEVSSALDKIKKIIEGFMNTAVKDVKQNNEAKKKDAKFIPSMEDGILIVDDIGVVTYQLKVLFEKEGFFVETAKDIYTAVNHFKKNLFSYIIMDLFVSTEREGYLLLDEVQKLIIKDNLKTKIIVITASNKAEHKLKCLNKGADRFINKEQGWQEEVLNICLGKEETEKEEGAE